MSRPDIHRACPVSFNREVLSWGTELPNELSHLIPGLYKIQISGEVLQGIHKLFIDQANPLFHYSLLPLLDWHLSSAEELDRLYSNEKLGNGGAAMTAWAYMQLAEMSPVERDALAAALKCYCELDTLAMVMIWEGWDLLIR